MTREELKAHCEKQIEMCEIRAIRMDEKPSGKIYEEHKLILELLEQQPCEMTAEEYRQRMIQAFHNADCDELIAICALPTEKEFEHLEWLLKNHYKKVPCEKREQGTGWILVSERVPEDTYPVNITWVNHTPEPYYATIKDKPFTATGCYCDGKWYWYSVTCQDYLDEYRYCDIDSMDEAIEVIAWMPLPEPYVPEINIGKMAESEDTL